MATFGLPEAIQAITFVVKIALDLRNEGKELARIYKEIEGVKNHLSLVETRMNNPKNPLGQTAAKIKAMLEQDCKDIKTGCDQAAQLLSERKRMHLLEFGSKILWIRVRIPELKDIISGFHMSTTSIDKKITLLLADAAERAEARAKASDAKAQKLADERAKKLEAKLDKMIAAQQRDKLAREEQARGTAMLVKLLAGLDTKAVESAALGEGDGKKSAEKWVDDLVKAGMKRKDAKAGLEATLSAVRSEKQDQKSTLKRAATDEAQKAAATPKAAPSVKVSSVPEAKAASNNIWLLCVDGSNGDRSIIAQTYLELVRAWTMNTQKRWLFNCVDSAGCLIPTRFSKPILEADGQKLQKADVLASKEAVAAIAGEDSYFWTNYPDEKGAILKRMREHKSCGLRESYFKKYEHIICFDERTRALVEKMKEVVAGTSKEKIKAKVHYVKESDWYRSGAASNKEALLRVTGQLKVALKRFLKLKFQWERPTPGIAGGEWRTALVVLADKGQKDKLEEKNGALVKKIWEKKGCSVQISPRARIRGCSPSLVRKVNWVMLRRWPCHLLLEEASSAVYLLTSRKTNPRTECC